MGRQQYAQLCLTSSIPFLDNFVVRQHLLMLKYMQRFEELQLLCNLGQKLTSVSFSVSVFIHAWHWQGPKEQMCAASNNYIVGEM